MMRPRRHFFYGLFYMQKSQRIGYIDALRGFTMFLVVFGHVLLGSFDIGGYNSVLSSILLTFRMPMFFFISGYIGYKAIDRWTWGFYKLSMKKKLIVQIIPAAFFFVVYSLCHNTNPLLFYKTGFGGYWFTFVLLEMFIVYFLTSLIACKLKMSWLVDAVLISCSILGILILTYHRNHSQVDSSLWNVFCLENLTKYMQFFTLGVLCRKYNQWFIRIISNDKNKGLVILLFIVTLFLYFSSTLQLKSPILFQLNHDILVRYLGVFMVFSFFHSTRTFWDKDNKMARTFLFVGRRTLDIYLIHFFFLPDLRFMHDWISKSDIILIQLIFGICLTICIIAFSLLISRLIRSSNLLAYYILGAKRETS